MEGDDAISKAMKKIGNRFLLVNAAAKRAKSLKKRLTFSEVESDGKLINRALEEMAEGKIRVADFSHDPGKPADSGEEDEGPRAA